MMRLGLSVYPEQEKLEDIEAYLKKGKEAGFDKVFTSLFSVDGTKEEIIEYFKNFTEIAHHYGYEVDGDCNNQFFEKMGAREDDLSVFKEMGIDTLRMDFPFNDERDAVLINNKDGIKIEFNTSMIDIVENALKNGADVKNITTCHNFYPQRYTCPSFEMVNDMNAYWKDKGIDVAMFMSSQEEGTHGPWPVSDGLPTIEEHRSIPVESQLKHMIAMKNVNQALFGNAYASDEEFEAIRKTMEQVYGEPSKTAEFHGLFAMIKDFLPKSENGRMPFKLRMDPGVTDFERELVFDFPMHSDLGDSMNYMLRSRFTRMMTDGKEIKPRKTDRDVFHRGDVLVVNDNCRHYAGEVQIVLKDMINDGQRNYIGTIDNSEQMILDLMGAGDLFTFEEAE